MRQERIEGEGSKERDRESDTLEREKIFLSTNGCAHSGLDPMVEVNVKVYVLCLGPLYVFIKIMIQLIAMI